MKLSDIQNIIADLDGFRDTQMRKVSDAFIVPKALQSQDLGTFGGIKIMRSQWVPDEAPAVQMHPDCDLDELWCTREFRAKTNAWLLERFGTVPVAYFLTDQQMLAMSHRMAARIDAEINKLCFGVRS